MEYIATYGSGSSENIEENSNSKSDSSSSDALSSLEKNDFYDEYDKEPLSNHHSKSMNFEFEYDSEYIESDNDVYVSDNEICFYLNDYATPYLKKGINTFSHQEIIDLLLNKKSTRVCTKRLIRVQENAVFLVDTSKFGDRKNVLQDDLGVWSNRGFNGNILTVEDGKIINSSYLSRSLKKRVPLEENQYILKRTYYKCASSMDYAKATTTLMDKNDTILDYMLIEYYFKGEPHFINVKPHGNSKQTKPYQPTSTRTKNILKGKVKNSMAGPSKIYDTVFEEVGGVENAGAISDFPRNYNQIKYLRNKMRKTDKVDEIAELITLASDKNSLISNLQFNPETRFVVAPKETLENIVEFCTDLLNPSVFVIDKTFSVGKFFVTTTCYQHLKVLERNSNKHPWIPGPALFHTEEKENVYRYFAQTLKEKNVKVQEILFIGMDREKAIKNGFTTETPFATVLFCTKHVLDSIKAKFSQLSLPRVNQNKILSDIIGCDTQKKKGLIDCSNADLFEGHLHQKYSEWDELTGSNQFSNYFRNHIKDDMESGMLLNIRQAAGLGANFFYSNPVESIHFKFKNRIRQKKTDTNASGRPVITCSYSEAAQIYQELLSEHKNNIQRAILDEGPYKLADSYKYLAVSHDEWFSSDLKTRKSLFAKLSTSQNDEFDTYRSLDMEKEDFDNVHNVDFPPFEMSGLPDSYKTDWNGVQYYLNNQQNAVQKSTIFNNTYHLKSRSVSNKTNNVRVNGNQIRCTCPRFTTCQICAHSIFIAFETGAVETFLSRWKPSLSKIIEPTTPKNAGHKKNKQPRKRKRTYTERDIALHEEVGENSIPGTDDKTFHVVFVKETRATTCYGCQQKFREKGDSQPPPSPYDIILGIKAFRVFSPPGSQILRVGKSKENTYFHIKKSCVKRKYDTFKIEVAEDVSAQLCEPHKIKLLSEFGLII